MCVHFSGTTRALSETWTLDCLKSRKRRRATWKNSSEFVKKKYIYLLYLSFCKNSKFNSRLKIFFSHTYHLKRTQIQKPCINNHDTIPTPLWHNLSVLSFLMTPTHPISLRNPCQCKFSLLASFTTVPFSQLRVMDSGAHQRTKGMKEVLIRSYLYSSVLQIQSLMTLKSCCTVNTKIILKTVTGSFCVWWYLGSVLAWFYYIVFVWCFIDKEERQCGQLLALIFPEWCFSLCQASLSETILSQKEKLDTVFIHTD